MRALVQRVSGGCVTIRDKNKRNEISKGLIILLGIKHADTSDDVIFVADKCCNLRIFEDMSGKMNQSLIDIAGDALIVSQFTLYGDTRKGNRPSFTEAAPPEIAQTLYNEFCARMREKLGEEKIKTGEFGAMMDVEIHNDGPVTVIVESKLK